MDFKARFQGKTSKITKEGHIDANKAGFDAGQGTPLRNNSTSKKQYSAHNNMSISRASKFSFKGSEQSIQNTAQKEP